MNQPSMTSKASAFAEIRTQIEQDPTAQEESRANRRRIEMVNELVWAIDVRRIELGLSKAELARRVDRDASSIRRLFSSGGNPEITLVAALADAVGMRVELAKRT